jgi:hypothetical protein
MSEDMNCRGERRSLHVILNIDDVGVAWEIAQGGRGKDVLHGRSETVTFNEYTLRELDEKRRDKCSMQFGGGKRNEVVDRRTGKLVVSNM